MDPKGLLLHLQDPTTSPYPEPDQSILYPLTQLFEDQVQYSPIYA